jgi:hypothetical protein
MCETFTETVQHSVDTCCSVPRLQVFSFLKNIALRVHNGPFQLFWGPTKLCKRTMNTAQRLQFVNRNIRLGGS